jgi:RNA recognition motif-containing protein
MRPQLYFVNVPYNCSERELQDWIESYGVNIDSVRIIRDLVSGVSPAFAYAALRDDLESELAVAVLNGQKIGNQRVTVSLAVVRRAVA